MDKKALRAEILGCIHQLSEKQLENFNCKIYENILELDKYSLANTIFVYVSVGFEVDTYRLIAHAFAQGKRVAIPLCKRGGIMEAVELHSLDDLVPDRFDIPSAPLGSAVIAPDELDFILVPGIAFGRQGNRLGRGGGYYDRYLARVSKKTALVGVCYEVQITKEIVMDPFDHSVDFVVTESDIYAAKK